MRNHIRLAVLGLAAATAVVVAGSALAAYTSPTLAVSQAGAVTTISFTTSASDDATARAVIYAPVGLAVTLGQAPATVLGKLDSTVIAGALGGAVVPLPGQVTVDDPARYTANTCAPGAHQAVWVLQIQAPTGVLNVPMYVDAAAGPEAQFAAARIQVCLPPPDIPEAQGGAALGAKLVKAQFSVQGVFGTGLGIWRALATPWLPAVGQVNAAATVAPAAAIAPGTVTAKARATKTGAVVTGKLEQGGTGLGGSNVAVWAGARRTALKRIGTARTTAAGTFAFTTRRKDSFFQARAVVGSRPAPPVCQLPNPLQPAPCVNPTVNGFTALSAITRK